MEKKKNGVVTYILKKIRQKGDRHIGRSAKMNSANIIINKNDRHLFSDDAIIKTSKLSEIHEKLTNYAKVTKNIKLK